MPATRPLTIDERRTYLGLMTVRYARAERKERSPLLDDMELVTALDRKTLISGDLARHPRRKERGRTYGPDVDDALRIIADSFDYLCAERITPNLPWMATCLAKHGELTVFPSLLDKLEAISVSTVRRILKRVTPKEHRLPRQGPGRPNPLTHAIPMTRIPWDEQRPGHFEADLVHHCGSSSAGQYAHTLQLVDVATAWSERVAMLGRSNVAMEKALNRILARLPFPLLELHPDNGSEFFNTPLILRQGTSEHCPLS